MHHSPSIAIDLSNVISSREEPKLPATEDAYQGMWSILALIGSVINLCLLIAELFQASIGPTPPNRASSETHGGTLLTLPSLVTLILIMILESDLAAGENSDMVADCSSPHARPASAEKQDIRPSRGEALLGDSLPLIEYRGVFFEACRLPEADDIPLVEIDGVFYDISLFSLDVKDL